MILKLTSAHGIQGSLKGDLLSGVKKVYLSPPMLVKTPARSKHFAASYSLWMFGISEKVNDFAKHNVASKRH